MSQTCSAARFIVSLSRCLGPKPAFCSSKASWRRSDVVVFSRASCAASPHHGVPATVPKSWATLRSAPSLPTVASLDLRVCEFSARKSRWSRCGRVRNSARVASSRRCRSEEFRIITRTCLARAPSLSSPDGESGKTKTSTIVSARALRARSRASPSGGDDRLMLIEILDS